MKISLLSLFNVLTPKEGGIRRIARDVAFGDDPRQRYDVYAPIKRKGPLPLLVYFYGGGWYSGTRADYAWMAHAFAAMGFVVAVPDYRVFPQAVYPAFVEDHAAAVKHMLARAGDYDGDASRLVLAGQSSGAYGAVMLALDPRWLGEGDPVTACVGIAGPYDFHPFNVKASQDAFGAWPDPGETQPVRHARKTRTHFLLMQSRADTVVGTHNSVNLAAALQAASTDARLKLYQGLTHEDTAAVFSLPFRRKATLYQDTKAFLDEVVFL